MNKGVQPNQTLQDALERIERLEGLIFRSKRPGNTKHLILSKKQQILNNTASNPLGKGHKNKKNENIPTT